MKHITWNHERQTAAEAKAAELSGLDKDYASAEEFLAATAAEVRVSELAGRADQLLAEIDSADAITAESIRIEVTRLFGICFDITQLLSLGNFKAAHHLSESGVGENGDMLAMAI